jgi:hypothetical protein
MGFQTMRSTTARSSTARSSSTRWPFAALVEDIGKNGLKHPIVKQPAPDNKIIDGRNRYLACRAAGKPPRFEDFKGGNVVAFIATENLHRRNLGTSQRAMVAARIKAAAKGEEWRSIVSPLEAEKSAANLRLVENIEETDTRVRSDQKTVALAKALNVSPRSVESADVVVAKGVPELAVAVAQEEITVAKAASIARLPEDQQRARVALFHACQEQAKEAAENERERATRRAERYQRRLPKETLKLFRSMTEEQRAEFKASLGMISLDDILSRAEYMFDSDRVKIAITFFNAIRSNAERLRVDAVVGQWSTEHMQGDAQEEDQVQQTSRAFTSRSRFTT